MLVNNNGAVPSSSLPLPVISYARVDMARRAASVMGASDANVVPVPAATVDRGVASPADISMDSGAIAAATGVTPRSWEEQVRTALA